MTLDQDSTLEPSIGLVQDLFPNVERNKFHAGNCPTMAPIFTLQRKRKRLGLFFVFFFLSLCAFRYGEK